MTARVLFVCLGNICRSPTAEAVFRARAEAAGLDAVADSAGTGGWHVGDPPDRRATEAARRRGYDLSALRARQVRVEDFHAFDHVLAMDADNLDVLRKMRPAAAVSTLGLLLEHAPHLGERETPDPYYGGQDGFDHVLDLIEAGCDGLIAALKAHAESANSSSTT